MDKPALDAPAEVDFYEAFRPYTALEKATLIWRMPKARPRYSRTRKLSNEQ